MSITTEMDQKIGSRPILRIQITTSGGTTNITSYLKSCGALEMEKSRTGQEALVSAGDMMFVFSNHDDKFTELDASSIFYGTTYIGNKIDIDFGFRKDDGTIEYQDQAVFKITQVYLNSESSDCYIIGRDNINRLNKFVLNVPSNAIVPVAGGSNVGNGYMTEIQTKPFGTVSENWTITCTLGGGSGVATFSVVGSTSGNIGTATSNTEFTTGSKIKFTIYAGGTNWVLNDVFTFTTRQLIEFTAKNPVKIIWSILTGHDYDTGTALGFHDSTPKMDSTQTAANTEINYPSFTTAVSELGTSFNLTGYIGVNANCSSTISDIIFHFLGTVYADANGKICVNTYTPSFGESTREFSSAKKITALQYKKDFENIINSCTAKYKKTASWAWSGEAETTDGTYTKTNSTSITNYGEQTFTVETYWLSVNNAAIQWAVDRIVDRYANPPLMIDFVTGADALQTVLGDFIQVTDAKTQLEAQAMEVFKLSKDFSEKPTKISISCADTNTTGFPWAYLGSCENETDHNWWTKFQMQTTQAHWNAGTKDNIDITTVAGNVQLGIAGTNKLIINGGFEDGNFDNYADLVCTGWTRIHGDSFWQIPSGGHSGSYELYGNIAPAGGTFKCKILDSSDVVLKTYTMVENKAWTFYNIIASDLTAYIGTTIKIQFENYYTYYGTYAYITSDVFSYNGGSINFYYKFHSSTGSRVDDIYVCYGSIITQTLDYGEIPASLGNLSAQVFCPTSCSIEFLGETKASDSGWGSYTSLGTVTSTGHYIVSLSGLTTRRYLRIKAILKYTGSTIDTPTLYSINIKNGWDVATTFEKQFCYASQTGGEGTTPEFYIF